MNLTEALVELVRVSGVTGGEESLARLLLARWSGLVDEAEIDRTGNYLGRRRGPGPRLMLAAHTDSIGLMIQSVDERGFLRFTRIGGVDLRYLVGQEVEIHTNSGLLAGLVGSRPPHITEAAERKKVPGVDDLFIDTGLPAATVREQVRPGDLVTFRRETHRLRGERLAGPYLDNRAGVACLYHALTLLQGREHPADLWVAGTVGEEFGGLIGAQAAAQRIRPAVAVAVDVTFGCCADGEPDHFALEGGPTIMVGPNCHPGLARLLRQLATARGIPHAVEVAGEHSGTDAWALQVVATGAVAGVVSIPLRYMHNPVETVSLADIRQAGALLAGLAMELEEGLVRTWTSLS